VKGFSSEMDFTTLVDHLEESINFLEKVIGDAVRDLQKAMNSNVGSRDHDIIETWCNGVLALSRMASEIMFNKLEEITMALTVRVVDKIIEAMLLLIPIMSQTNIRSKPGLAGITAQARLQVNKLEYLYVYDGVFRFQVVVGQLDEIFDMEPRAETTSSAMTDTVDTLRRLPVANVQ